MPIALALMITTAVTVPAVPADTTGTGANPTTEPLAHIRAAALDFAHAHLGVAPRGDAASANQADSRFRLEISGLDERLRLQACAGPLQASAGPGAARGGRMTVLVRCTGTPGWKVYVRMSVREYREIVVASRALGRGQAVSEADVALAEREVSRLHMAYTAEAGSIIGRTLKRNVRRGEPIALDALEQRLLVHNGEQVTLVSGAGSYAISMAGVALNDAAQGGRVSVRNLSSGRIVEGRAIDAGTVRVGPAGGYERSLGSR